MSTATLAPVPRVAPSVRRASTVLLVDRIEPCLEFWTQRLGFVERLKIEGNTDGVAGAEFAIVGRGDVEFMFRTVESLGAEVSDLADIGEPAGSLIYLEVDSVEALLPQLDGADIIAPIRQTSLGTTEVYLREPSGRIVVLQSYDEP